MVTNLNRLRSIAKAEALSHNIAIMLGKLEDELYALRMSEKQEVHNMINTLQLLEEELKTSAFGLIDKSEVIEDAT